MKQREESRQPALHPILRRLAGGDRRSIGRANQVVTAVLTRPELFDRVFEGITSRDPLVRMRAADAAEKVSAKRPELLAPCKKKILHIAARTEEQEIRWHMALMIPRLPLTPRERGIAVDILFDYLRDKSSIVKSWAMQALADLAARDEDLKPMIRPLVEELTAVGTPAMRARCRRILQRWDPRPVKSSRARAVRNS